MTTTQPLTIVNAYAALQGSGVHVIDAGHHTPGALRLTVSAGHERAAVACALQAGWDASSSAPQLVTIVAPVDSLDDLGLTYPTWQA